MTNTSGLRKQICITGANGFIGRQLVDSLLQDGHFIRVLTRNTGIEFPANVEVIVGDLTKSDCPLDQFMHNCDIIIHCAGEIHNIELMSLLHVDGTSRLINSALKEGDLSGKKLHWVQLSSCGAYGPPVGRTEISRIITEDSSTNPENEYEFTKAKSDELVISACKDDKMTFSILRPSNVFGINMKDQSLQKLIGMIRKKRFFFLGKPGAIVTYVHVNDVVNALAILAIDPRAKGKVYNLSSDCTLEELAESISIILKVPKPKLRLPAKLIRIPLFIMAALLKKWIHVPKLDALVLRTEYPANKIKSELDFVFLQPMPGGIEALINNRA